MDISKVYEEAIGLAKSAVEADRASDMDKALDLYMRALDRFLCGIQCTSTLCHCNLDCSDGGHPTMREHGLVCAGTTLHGLGRC